MLEVPEGFRSDLIHSKSSTTKCDLDITFRIEDFETNMGFPRPGGVSDIEFENSF